jgi:hypothetical protein
MANDPWRADRADVLAIEEHRQGSPVRAPAKSSCDRVGGQRAVRVAGVGSERGGNVGGVAEPECGDGEVALAGHDLRVVGGTDLGAILVVGDIADPRQPVLDVPLSLSSSGWLCRSGGHADVGRMREDGAGPR